MSEFGRGFSYCLGLFLCHAERAQVVREESEQAHMWFYAASDHLIELQAPLCFSQEKISEIEAFKDLCINYRWGDNATWQDVKTAIQTAKDFLLEFDKRAGIDAEKADWQ